MLVRCFPHSINRAVVAVSDSIKQNRSIPSEKQDAIVREHGCEYLEAYTDAVTSDPIKRVRQLVAACRKSDRKAHV